MSLVFCAAGLALALLTGSPFLAFICFMLAVLCV